MIQDFLSAPRLLAQSQSVRSSEAGGGSSSDSLVAGPQDLNSPDGLDAAFAGDQSAMRGYLTETGQLGEDPALEAAPEVELANAALGAMIDHLGGLPDPTELNGEVRGLWIPALDALDPGAIDAAGATLLLRWDAVESAHQEWEALVAEFDASVSLSGGDARSEHGLAEAWLTGAQLKLAWQQRWIELRQPFGIVGLSYFGGSPVDGWAGAMIVRSREFIEHRVAEAREGVLLAKQALDYLSAGGADDIAGILGRVMAAQDDAEVPSLFGTTAFHSGFLEPLTRLRAIIEPAATRQRLYSFLRAVLRGQVLPDGHSAWDAYEAALGDEEQTRIEDALEGSRHTDLEARNGGIEAEALEMAELAEDVDAAAVALEASRVAPTLSGDEAAALADLAQDLGGSVDEARAMMDALLAEAADGAAAVRVGDAEALTGHAGAAAEMAGRLEELLSGSVSASLAVDSLFPAWENVRLDPTWGPALEALEATVEEWASARTAVATSFDLPSTHGGPAAPSGSLAGWLGSHVAEAVAPVVADGAALLSLAPTLPAQRREGAEVDQLRALFEGRAGRAWLYLYGLLEAAGAPGWIRAELTEERGDQQEVEAGVARGLSEARMLELVDRTSYLESMTRAMDAQSEARDAEIEGGGLLSVIGESFADDWWDAIHYGESQPLPLSPQSGENTISDEQLAQAAVRLLQDLPPGEREEMLHLLVQHNVYDRVFNAAQGTLSEEQLQLLRVGRFEGADYDPERLYDGGIVEGIGYAGQASLVGAAAVPYGMASSLPFVGDVLETWFGGDYRRALVTFGESLGLAPEDAAAALAGGELTGGVTGIVGQLGLSMRNPQGVLRLLDLGLNVGGTAEGLSILAEGETLSGRQVEGIDQIVAGVGGLAGVSGVLSQGADVLSALRRLRPTMRGVSQGMDIGATLTGVGAGATHTAANPEHSGNLEDWVTDYQSLVMPVISAVRHGGRFFRRGGSEPAEGTPSEDGTTRPNRAPETAPVPDSDVQDLPVDTLIEPADPTSRQAADDIYERCVADSPSREAALVVNLVTGEHRVLQGHETGVGVGRILAEAGLNPMEWSPLRHFHPRTQALPGRLSRSRLPSGSGGDMQMLYELAWSPESPLHMQPVASRIDVELPDGTPDQIRFGYDPVSDSYWVNYPDDSGNRVYEERPTIEQYNEFVLLRTGGLPGEIPSWMTRTQELPAVGADPQSSEGSRGGTETTPFQGELGLPVDQGAIPDSPEAREQAFQNLLRLLGPADSALGRRIGALRDRVAAAREGASDPTLEADLRTFLEEDVRPSTVANNPLLRDAYDGAIADLERSRTGNAMMGLHDLLQEEVRLADQEVDTSDPDWETNRNDAQDDARDAYGPSAIKLYTRLQRLFGKHLTAALATAGLSPAKLVFELHHLLYKSEHPEHAIEPRNLLPLSRELHELFHSLTAAGAGEHFKVQNPDISQLLQELLDL